MTESNLGIEDGEETCEESELVIKVSNVILPWASSEYRNRNVVLLDLQADEDGAGNLRLDLNIVFNPIPIRRGNAVRVDYYVGSTGIEVLVEAKGGSVFDYSQPIELVTNYSNTVSHNRERSLKLVPEIFAKSEVGETNAKFGEVSYKRSQNCEFSVSFSSSERILNPTSYGDSVKWTLALPRGEKAIRDFLIGNLYLYARCKWATELRDGKINVRPSDVRFFDADKKAIRNRANYLMLYAMWKNGIKLENRDGFDCDFNVEK